MTTNRYFIIAVCVLLPSGFAHVQEKQAKDPQEDAIPGLTVKELWIKETLSLPRIWFNHDGSQLAVGDADGTVRMLDARSGDEKNAFKAGKSEVVKAAFHPNADRFIWVPSQSSEIRMWDYKTGREIWRMIPDSGAVRDFAFHPDGRTIAICGYNKKPITGVVKLLDAATGELKKTMSVKSPFSNKSVSSVGFSSDGKLLAYCVPRYENKKQVGDLVIWSLEESREIRIIKGAFEMAISTTWTWFNSDSTHVVTADILHANVWNAKNGELICRFPNVEKLNTYERSYSPTRNLLATSYLDKRTMTKKIVLVSPNHPGKSLTLEGEFGSIAISPDGRWLARAQGNGIRVWALELNTDKEIRPKQ